MLGFKDSFDAINRDIINGDRNPDTLTIVGVIENFHQRSVQFAMTPIVFLLGQDSRGFYTVKMNTANVSAALKFMEQSFHKHFDGPFDFFFLDDYFNNQYNKDEQFGTMFGLFTVVAIWISCLGLFAMAKFSAEQRNKEIGIRKILGASVYNIVAMLGSDFLKPVGIAIIASMPVAWWVMYEWLQNYASRIEISAEVFLFGGGSAVLIAMLTISIQATKSGLMNPVKSLKTE